MAIVRLENKQAFAANWQKSSPYFIARMAAEKRRREALLGLTPRGVQKTRAKAAKRRLKNIG